MIRDKTLKDAEQVKKLAEKLQTSKKIREFGLRYPKKDEGEEAWTLAHSFSDLEESFRKFLEVHLPRLLKKAKGSNEVEDVLLDIGEEFRHILYHIKDPKFYSYLFSDKEE